MTGTSELSTSNPAWQLLQLGKYNSLFEHHEATFGQNLTESPFKFQTCVDLIRKAQSAMMNICKVPRFILFHFKCNPYSFLRIRFMMFLNAEQIVLLLLPILVQSATVTYTIPSAAPTTAVALDPAPLGVS